MKTYTVTLRITTKYGDPAAWDWQDLTGAQVTVQGADNKRPAYQNRDNERAAIMAAMRGTGRPLTTAAIATLTGLKPLLAGRLVFELKTKRKLREAGRDDSGFMMYEVA